MRGKKGAYSILENMSFVEFAMIALIILMLLSYTSLMGSRNTIARNYVLNDIGLALQAMMKEGGNMALDYPFSTGPFGFTFTEGSVKIYDTKDSISPSGAYYFVQLKGANVVPSQLKPKNAWDDRLSDEENARRDASVRLRFCKIGGKISVMRQDEDCII